MPYQYVKISRDGESWEAEIDFSQTIVDDQEVISDDVYELGVDELPPGVEDIQGNVFNEPLRLFWLQQGDQEWYFGLDPV